MRVTQSATTNATPAAARTASACTPLLPTVATGLPTSSALTAHPRTNSSTSRHTLLYGQPGSDKTALLKNDLMPLLRRRAGDRLGPALVRESGVVVPFPDRRGRA